MADNQESSSEDTAVTSEQDVQETASTDSTPAQETDWKEMARKWEARAKENKAAADRLNEIEEASKSEQQKLQEKFDAVSRELDAYKTREQVAAWASEIVDGSDVPATVLRGSTREELQAHFDELKTVLGARPKMGASTVLGYQPKNSPKESDTKQVLRQIFNKE